MADKGGQPTSLSEAKRLGSPTYKPMTGRNKGKIIAAVSKEELKKSGMSLREFLNKRRKDARKSGEVAGAVKTPKTQVAPRPKAKSSKRTDTGQRPDNRPVKSISKTKSQPSKRTDTGQRPDNRPVKSTPKSKSSPRGSSAPINITGGTVPSRGTGKTDPYKYVGKGPRGEQGQAPIPTTEEKIGMASLVLGGLGGPGAKLATKAATTYGKPFVNQLIRKIKDLSKKEQEDILKLVARSKLSKKEVTEAVKNAKSPNNIIAQVARQKSATSGQRAPGEQPFKQTTVRKRQQDRNRQRRQETQKKQELKKMNVQGAGSTRIPSARLRKKGGPIKKYNKGGKVVNRKGGGMVGSGNDLVASIYD